MFVSIVSFLRPFSLYYCTSTSQILELFRYYSSKEASKRHVTGFLLCWLCSWCRCVFLLWLTERLVCSSNFCLFFTLLPYNVLLLLLLFLNVLLSTFTILMALKLIWINLGFRYFSLTKLLHSCLMHFLSGLISIAMACMTSIVESWLTPSFLAIVHVTVLAFRVPLELEFSENPSDILTTFLKDVSCRVF